MLGRERRERRGGGRGYKGACVFLTVGNLRCPLFALLLGSPLFCVDPPQEAVMLSSVCVWLPAHTN